jgi:hypothetical protein
MVTYRHQVVRAARLLSLGLAFASASAWGQSTPPPGGGATPAAAPSGPGQGFVVTDEDDRPAIYGLDEDSTSPSTSKKSARGDVQGVHVVRKGDTLWDICKAYFNNPWEWPKIWSYNPTITNPHWIFPGDHVRLSADAVDRGEATEANIPASTGKVERHRTGRIVRLGGQIGGNGFQLRELGFVEEGELAAAAVVSGSREEKIMLSMGDQAYLDFPSGQPLHAGERYTIYKVERDVSYPISNEGKAMRLGYVVLILGEVQVDQVTTGGIARATIVDCNTAIERGYRVGPLARRWKTVEQRTNQVTLEAMVVGSLKALTIIPGEEVVFVDKGKQDGVVDGNRFFAIHRGDGYKKTLSSRSINEDPRYPKEVTAEIIVVEAHEHTSVGYVSKMFRELQPGDHLEMRRGY